MGLCLFYTIFGAELDNGLRLPQKSCNQSHCLPKAESIRNRAGADVPIAIPQLVVTIPSKQAGVRGVVQAAASP